MAIKPRAPAACRAQEKGYDLFLAKAHGIYTDLGDYVEVVTNWVDFQLESVAILHEVTQLITDLGVSLAVAPVSPHWPLLRAVCPSLAEQCTREHVRGRVCAWSVQRLACFCVVSTCCPLTQLDWNPEIAIPFLDLIALLFRTTHVMSTLTDCTIAVGLWGAASEIVNKASAPEMTYQR
jgi:hypothetical protein